MKKMANKLLKSMLNRLPGRIRDEAIRRSIHLPDKLPENLVFKIAETTEELEASFRLVYESYLPLGYCAQNEHQMRATIYHALPTTTTLIAVDNGRVVGTATVVRDNRLGLPLDKVFDASALRKNSHRLAEITSMVIHKDYRREKGGQILFPLIRLMYEYSTSCFGVNHLVITIHPKDVYFYTSLLLYKIIPNSGVKDYLGAPAIALHLDLQQALLDYQETYAHRTASTNLFDFFVRRKISNVLIPKREYNIIDDPVVTFDYFKKNLTKLGLGLSDLRKIKACFHQADSHRSHPRMEVEAPAKLDLQASHKNIQIQTTIKDVSRDGFRAYCTETFCIRDQFNIQIEIGPNIFAQVKAQAVWMSPDRGIGFKILEADEKWHQFINFLYKEQLVRVA
jgi:hypothetical protein